MRTILLNERNEFKDKKDSKSMSYAIKKLGNFYSNIKPSAEISTNVKSDVHTKKK